MFGAPGEPSIPSLFSADEEFSRGIALGNKQIPPLAEQLMSTQSVSMAYQNVCVLLDTVALSRQDTGNMPLSCWADHLPFFEELPVRVRSLGARIANVALWQVTRGRLNTLLIRRFERVCTLVLTFWHTHPRLCKREMLCLFAFTCCCTSLMKRRWYFTQGRRNQAHGRKLCRCICPSWREVLERPQIICEHRLCDVSFEIVALQLRACFCRNVQKLGETCGFVYQLEHECLEYVGKANSLRSSSQVPGGAARILDHFRVVIRMAAGEPVKTDEEQRMKLLKVQGLCFLGCLFVDMVPLGFLSSREAALIAFSSGDANFGDRKSRFVKGKAANLGASQHCRVRVRAGPSGGSARLDRYDDALWTRQLASTLR